MTQRLEIINSEEYWSTFDLIDGTVLRVKIIGLYAEKLPDGGFNLKHKLVLDFIPAPEKQPPADSLPATMPPRRHDPR
jgi:hypothetical protein